jgi:nucleoid-associated protein YgaU
MAVEPPEKLTILVELPGGKLQFDEKSKEHCIKAMFNPSRLTISRSAQWKSQEAAKRDNPELQFTSAEAATLSVDLFFDTYDSPDKEKQDVRVFTDKLLFLTTVEKHGDKHRPPVCRVSWGHASGFFQGVLEKLEQQFTLFMENGKPVRATLKCSFKAWQTNEGDFRRQNTHSADVAKVWVVKRSETLASIAAYEYRDPRKWRPIAEANGIDNPIDLSPGTALLLPTLREP